MGRVAKLALLSALVLGFAGSAGAVPIIYNADLDGPSEATPNASPGTGEARVIYDPIAHTMRVRVSFTGLTGLTTASHIHCCTASPNAGAAGVATTTPTFTGFPLGVTSGFYLHTFDMTLASSYNPSFVTANGGTTATAETALFAGMAAEETYLNVHTKTFGGGEIRGFLHPVPEPASLTLLGIGLAIFGATRRRRSSQPESV